MFIKIVRNVFKIKKNLSTTGFSKTLLLETLDYWSVLVFK